jgi:uncharacterized protein (TIGR02599 family)
MSVLIATSMRTSHHAGQAGRGTCSSTHRGPGRGERGFTLVEMLVSMALLAMIAAVLATVLSLLANAQKYVSGQTSSFEDASLAFQSMTRTLSQASLETYFDYYPSQAAGLTGTVPPPPTAFIRQSNLHFICDQAVNLLPGGSATVNPTHAVFFQSLLGYSEPTDPSYAAIPDLLNACGYYIAFGSNVSTIPGLSALEGNATYRYRLMEMMQPTEEMGVYADLETTEPYKWIQTPITNNEVRPVADNIIALVIEPQYSTEDQVANGSTPLTPNYFYDSRQDAQTATQPPNANQLPSIVKVTMVAIDEASAIRLARLNQNTNPPALLPAGIFTSSEPGQYDADIVKLTNALQSTVPPVNYRIFVASVPMRSAKWSNPIP